MFDLSGRVALVTGAGQGVGAGIARQLASQGASVAINDVDPARAKESAAAVVAGGSRAEAVAFDVSDFDAVVAGVAAAEAALGPIDILVNNAGVPAGMGLSPFRSTSADAWRAYIDINLYGVMNCSKAVVDGMCDRGFGRVITISSAAGQTGLAIGVSAYAAGKGGGIAFMRHLALETAASGVTANTVALGLMDNVPAEAVAGLSTTIPTGRLGSPDDVGACCAYLASDEAAWMTGQTIGLNGGSVTS
jgi:NAD(P)-dependent dehydrogenase (short-subunit alcohol dehydrogenase family)